MISYANAAGDRAPRHEPVITFDPGYLSQPVCGVIFGRPAKLIEPPKEGEGRVIKQSMAYPKDHAPKAKNTSPMTIDAVRARYVGCLSKTKWISAAEIASILNVHATSVHKTMRRDYMKEVAQVKEQGNRIVWKLK